MRIAGILTTLVTATALTGTLPISPAVGAPATTGPAQTETAAAAPAVRKPIPCRGGFVRINPPVKIGRTVKASATVYCAAYPGPRSGHIGFGLQPRIGIPTLPFRVTSRPVRKTFTVQAACKPGRHLYTATVKGAIKEGRGPSRTFQVQAATRISC
ncbi:hypothetical protein [Rhizohabitans arisaemae]|uniref:hypothetical protein n=1 Tax=Rhizohabitans arisaemae TaxID=2720610 RepID=UPI0024B147D8|nr:hypothetical protein [Rhizohabitans arisaemae]